MNLTRNRHRAMIAAITVLAAVAPVAAVAQTSGFGDVGPTHTHLAGITYVADAGITTGCGDGTNFCPGNPVTRGQMATFLHRASGRAPGIAPSVNAATLDGRTRQQLSHRLTRGLVSTGGTTVTLGQVGVFQKIADLGTFTKQHVSTMVEATYVTYARVVTGTQCVYQLRINGQNATGGTLTTQLDGYEARVGATTVTPFHLESLFPVPVNPGTYTLELWVGSQTAGGQCQEGGGQHPRRWQVVEMPT